MPRAAASAGVSGGLVVAQSDDAIPDGFAGSGFAIIVAADQGATGASDSEVNGPRVYCQLIPSAKVEFERATTKYNEEDFSSEAENRNIQVPRVSDPSIARKIGSLRRNSGKFLRKKNVIDLNSRKILKDYVAEIFLDRGETYSLEDVERARAEVRQHGGYVVRAKIVEGENGSIIQMFLANKELNDDLKHLLNNSKYKIELISGQSFSKAVGGP